MYPGYFSFVICFVGFIECQIIYGNYKHAINKTSKPCNCFELMYVEYAVGIVISAAGEALNSSSGKALFSLYHSVN